MWSRKLILISLVLCHPGTTLSSKIDIKENEVEPLLETLLDGNEKIKPEAIMEDKPITKQQNSNARETQESHSRKKRFVYINTESPTDIGFLIVIPYSFALPTFNLQTSRRYKKSITLENERLANLTSDEILPSDSFDEPPYAIELRKLSSYFSVLKIDEDICQQKIICQVFSDPEKYQPLTSIIGKKLTADHGPIQEKLGSRYYRYVKAMQEGISGGDKGCHNVFKRCPYSAEDRFNMQALHFWAFLTNILQLDFKDEHFF